MGNSSSSNARRSSFTREQQDLQYLAEHFAFGDTELRLLYQAYHQVLKTSSSERHSFLLDWGLACGTFHNSSSSKDVEAEVDGARRHVERRALLEQADEILGDFGNRLYAKVFLAAGDVSVYDKKKGRSGEENGAAGNANPSEVVDEYTRTSRLHSFFQGLARCSRRGSQATMTALVQTLENDQHQVDSLHLVTLGYNLAIATALMQQNLDIVPPADAATLQGFADSLLERALSNRQRYGGEVGVGGQHPSATESHLVGLTDILEWVDDACPVFASILPSFLWQVFFPNFPYPPSRTAFEFPRLLSLNISKNNYMKEVSKVSEGSNESNGDGHSSNNEDNNNDNDANNSDTEILNTLIPPTSRYVLACWSSSLNGSYFPIYNSEQDGLSFNRLQNALLGYSGPTLMVITTRTLNNTNNVLGAFTASKWKELKTFYGTSDTFLWTLQPKIRVFRPRGGQDQKSSQNFQYCNSSARSKGYDQQAHGLGFGGTVQRPRLFLSETFDNCHADSQDMTFDNGRLLVSLDSTNDAGMDGGSSPTCSFTPDSLQVWGVGGDAVVQAALQARGQHRDLVDAGIRKARKVDKAAFLDDFRSGVIDSKAFAHRQQIDGRADQDCEARHQQQKN